MDVNAQQIKSQRNSRGWTQQHLADVCNVSLRTIQRVERYGAASSDTVMGIASAFEIELVEILRILPKPENEPESIQSPSVKLIPVFV